MYKTIDGKRVPGVTTIVGRFKDAGGLIHWAHKIGLEGGDINEVRDHAASAGKIAHQWIDDVIHERPRTDYPDVDPDLIIKATSAVDAFDAWRLQVTLEIVDTERPHVSEEHRFGGTYDAVARIAGKLALLDWKTSNKIYSDYVVQLAAYRQLYLERTGEKLSGAHLLRVGKEFGDFHYHSFPDAVLDQGWEAFKHMRALYDIDAVLKKVAA